MIVAGRLQPAAMVAGSLRTVAIGAAVLMLAGCASPKPTGSPAAPSATAVESTAPASLEPTPSPTAATTGPAVPSALDGLLADPSVANRLPIAVMIDDNAVARPQSGFNAASIVYQAPADGGEDRYMLVFQELNAPDLGPVRSGRPYFVYWAAEYRAGFAHYGGDEKTRLKVIPPIDGVLIYNLDALSGSNPAFHRIASRDAPHNAYTSTADLYRVAASHGYPASMVAGLTARPFKDDAVLADRPASGSISIPYGTGTTSYTYDAASNSYLRSVAGQPQFDPMDGRRVVARDVIVLWMGLSVDPQSEPGHARPVLAQIGSGTAWAFRDGHIIKGTWRKKDAGSLTRLYDAAGVEIPLVRGRIFFQVVATGTKVTYSAAS